MSDAPDPTFETLRADGARGALEVRLARLRRELEGLQPSQAVSRSATFWASHGESLGKLSAPVVSLLAVRDLIPPPNGPATQARLRLRWPEGWEEVFGIILPWADPRRPADEDWGRAAPPPAAATSRPPYEDA
jgi:hypothetical protein